MKMKRCIDMILIRLIPHALMIAMITKKIAATKH